jgi:predicted transposase YdaD
VSYDNVCKFLAEQYPEAFVRWLLMVQPQQIEVLKTELTLEPIRADSVTFLQTDEFILHLEFQTLPPSKPPIPFRMLDYSVRLKRQYNCAVVQIAIFLQETRDEIAYTEEYRDDTTLHRYRVVRLWEEDSEVFLESPALFPLAPLTRSDSPQGVLARVAQNLEKIPEPHQKANLAGCTEILAGLRFDRDLIRQFLREEIMQESVIYQDILQKGRRLEVLGIIQRLLKSRFGEVNPSILDRIQGLSIEQMESLIEALFNISQPVELIAWLEQQTEG